MLWLLIGRRAGRLKLGRAVVVVVAGLRRSVLRVRVFHISIAKKGCYSPLFLFGTSASLAHRGIGTELVGDPDAPLAGLDDGSGDDGRAVPAGRLGGRPLSHRRWCCHARAGVAEDSAVLLGLFEQLAGVSSSSDTKLGDRRDTGPADADRVGVLGQGKQEQLACPATVARVL